MEKFLESNDPYIINIGIEKLERELAGLQCSLSVVKGKIKEREELYQKEAKKIESILKKLKTKQNEIQFQNN